MSKKREVKLVTCGDCKSSTLMQWGNDPIIAECGHTGERNVASSKMKCPLHDPELEKKEKEIIRYRKHYGRFIN